MSSISTCPVDAQSIPPILAARLFMAAVGHVLYAKGQVPFPIGQLVTIPMSDAKSRSSAHQRAAKRRDELLDALESLDSQLTSSLQQLSWTLASQHSYTNAIPPSSTPRKLHLMIIMGNSITSPKARVAVEMEHFEARPFGWRDEFGLSAGLIPHGLAVAGPPSHTLLSEAKRIRGSEEESCSDEETTYGSDSEDTDRTSDGELGDHDGGVCFDDVVEGVDDDEEDDSEDDVDDDDDDESEEDGSFNSTTSPKESSTSPSQSPSPGPSAYTNHKHQEYSSSLSVPSEAQLRAAERTMYRILATSLSSSTAGEDEEIAPTSSHVLLRAPRKFKHFAWDPRQAYSKDMDAVLEEVFGQSDAGVSMGALGQAASEGKVRHMSSRRVRTQGVRVRCTAVDSEDRDFTTSSTAGGARGGMASYATTTVKNQERATSAMSDDADGRQEEGEEMIWWQWNGKLKGIGDDLF